jgi:lipopolysaccharide transport system ATP-binding protein
MLRKLRLMGGRSEDLNGNAIVVDNVSKTFMLPHERKITVFEHLAALFKGNAYRYETFYALKNLSFSVKHGETFGLIGPNGSGKSTLLKVVAGVLYPDEGRVAINGQVAPFLELGVGFQPELTAKENVYLYGAIMGLTRGDIDNRYEEIMEFSELKRFESMKLRSFSSGMYVRLAFATAIQTDPDIMLVDEVLAVGDEAFQKKCSEKIDEIRKAGKTILLVSHALGTVQSLCDRCLLLNGGEMVSLGETESVLAEYERMRGER